MGTAARHSTNPTSTESHARVRRGGATGAVREGGCDALLGRALYAGLLRLAAISRKRARTSQPRCAISRSARTRDAEGDEARNSALWNRRCPVKLGSAGDCGLDCLRGRRRFAPFCSEPRPGLFADRVGDRMSSARGTGVHCASRTPIGPQWLFSADLRSGPGWLPC